MRSQIVLFVSLVVTLFNGVQLFAQSSVGKNGPPVPNTDRTPLPPIDASMPINDNIIVLIIAGIALGVYYAFSLHMSKKKAA